jgi:glutamate dehydrogenase (NADP+)
MMKNTYYFDFMSYVQKVLQTLKDKYPYQPEFLQATEEVLYSISDFLEAHNVYEENGILERIVSPDRIYTFRVTWEDDNQKVHVNTGYRVEFNNAIGPYKGGLRFHPTVNESILKFLGFEQVFKNALTGLPLGGGKGGSDFDPSGKSDREVMRFSQSFMNELYKHIGADIDVPAGDIGVGGREVGFLFGKYKKLTHRFEGVLTGKGLSFGGSNIRTEATGYGLVYFVKEVLTHQGESLENKSILISGSGNVAQYAAEKSILLGATVLTMSDSSGTIYFEEGISQDILQKIMDIKNVKRGRIKEILETFPEGEYLEGKNPWDIKADIALPCATQNEISIEDASHLMGNNISIVAEGSNMSTTNDAVNALQESEITYIPGKASNAGGVAVSGLEMSQNSQRLYWSREDVDTRLQQIMRDIHEQTSSFGKRENGTIDYVKGANIAGFKKVADAMLAQGIV